MLIFIHYLITRHFSHSVLLKIVHRILCFKLLLRSKEFHLAFLVLVESHLLSKRSSHRHYCLRRNFALGTPRIFYQLVSWHHMIPLHRVVVFSIHDMTKVLGNSNVLLLNTLHRGFVLTLIRLRLDAPFTLDSFVFLQLDPFPGIFIVNHL